MNFTQPITTPLVDQSGLFQMTMYRGLSSQRNHSEFASDPGDYGRGEYWAGDESFAKDNYGPEVICKEIQLTNALRMSSQEVGRNARERGLTRMEDGPESRLMAATAFTEELVALGYDGIVVEGYEIPGLWSACVFSEP